VERVENNMEIDCPIRTVYNQWTQFEEFPRFMSGVKEVEQLDDTHVRWRAAIFGQDIEWDVEITEQVPDERISWRSTSGAPNTGTVRFEPLPGNRTLVRLSVSYDPQGFAENAGNALGLFAAHVDNTMQDFKSYIEKRQVADGAWRGEVHGGQRAEIVSDRRPTEARIRQ
jgi:uncharacterized membrane protein